MSLAENFFVWLVSFLILAIILLIVYKISYKLGIKKALYRTTYILLSVIFAFVLAPLVNSELFHFDLSKIGLTLKYQGQEFTTAIDFLEELIIHNEVLNDLYKYVPSLKELLMDFPQLILMPLTYVFLFILFMIVWAPLYFYLSFKRKRRVLYERRDNKEHRVFAGLLGCVQVVFVVSVLLSPLNWICNIYDEATSNTLDNKYSSLCDEHEALEKYEPYCTLIETYNSTVFATIGGNGSANNRVLDSLTRITYEDDYSTLSEEATLIIKGGIVLNQSGILDSVIESNDTFDIDKLLKNNLSEEDIDIIVDTISNSNYSEEVLLELEKLAANTLNDLMKMIMNDSTFTVQYFLNKDDAINEIKTILKAFMSLSNNSLLSDVIKAGKIIVEFVDNVPFNRISEQVILQLVKDIVNTVDLDRLEEVAEYLFESKIFNALMPYVLNKILGQVGFDFVNKPSDILTHLKNLIELAKLVKKYQPESFLGLVGTLNDVELRKAAKIVGDFVHSEDSSGFIKFVLAEIPAEFENYLPRDIFKIKNWEGEAVVLQKFCVFLDKILYRNEVDLNLVREMLAYKDSEVVAVLLDAAKLNISFFWKQIMISIGK